MLNIFLSGVSVVSKHSRFMIVVALVVLFQTSVCLLLAAETKPGTTISLQELIKLSLDDNSKNRANKNIYNRSILPSLLKNIFTRFKLKWNS